MANIQGINDVKVKIDFTKPTGKLDFGFPLILSVSATAAVAYAECTSLDAVVTSGYANSTDMYKAASLMFSQDNPPAKIAVCSLTSTIDLSTISNKNWRQLCVIDGEASDIAVIKTYIEATDDKMFFAVAAPTEASKTAGLTALGNSDRIIGFVHTNPIAACALAGEAAGREVGSFTYKNIILRGIEPMNLTVSELESIHTAGGISFVTKCGDNVTSEGQVMSKEYVDLVDCRDYVIQQLTYRTQRLLNSAGKIPYDNVGIGMLETIAVDVMRDCYTRGMIATDENGTPAYSVNYALVETVDDTDRANRHYIGGQFSFRLSGAIHTVDITGEILI